MMEKIGIIGIGVLGSAVASYYEENGFKVFCYDKFKNIGSIEDVNKADIVFVCVPTPRGKNNECDISIVDEAIGYLAGEKIVIIKSTVVPFTTDALQVEYSQHDLIFNPEFLTEKRARSDFAKPIFNIIGYSLKIEHSFTSARIGVKIATILPYAPVRIMPAAAAEMFKYVRNCYLATKNSFFSQIYDLCQQTGIDYSFIKNCAEVDPWIGPEHLDPNQDGYRGFNGKCLPKDTEALLKFADECGVDLSVLKGVVEYNSKLLVLQGIKKGS